MSNGIEQNFNFGSFSFIDGDDKQLDGVEVDENNQSKLTYTFTEADIGIKTFKGKFTGDGTQAAGTSNDFTVKVTAADGRGGATGQTPYVTQIVAGPGIYISPSNGRGVVTISTKPFTGPTEDDLYDVSWTKTLPITVANTSVIGGTNSNSTDLFFEAKKSGYFIAVGLNGTTLISGDGDNWINLGTKDNTSVIQGVLATSEEDDGNGWYRTMFLGFAANSSNGPVNYIGNETGWTQTFTISGQANALTTPYAVETDDGIDWFGGGYDGIFFNSPSNDRVESGWALETETTILVNQFADNSDGGSSYSLVAVGPTVNPESGGLYANNGAILFSSRSSGTTGTWDSVFEVDDDAPIGVATDGTNWVAVGDLGGVWISSDGETWTASTAAFLASWSYVTYGNGKFVAVGYSSDGTSGAVMYSDDAGETWTKGSSGSKKGLLSVAYSPDLNVFVAVGEGGTTVSVTG